jgi:diadenosine tetraphosphate (Ap4A) HIT family hydrolase
MDNNRVIFETEYWRVKLSDNQYHLGRCVIELKRKCGNLSELNNKEWVDFSELVKRLETAMKKAFNANMFNWTCLMNDAYKQPKLNPQVHWHFRPRYKDKIVIEGITFEDKEFAHHYDNKAKLDVPDNIKENIITRIKKEL